MDVWENEGGAVSFIEKLEQELVWETYRENIQFSQEKEEENGNSGLSSTEE